MNRVQQLEQELVLSAFSWTDEQTEIYLQLHAVQQAEIAETIEND